MRDRPTIVCLCGSTRFGAAFETANLTETLAGKIVLTVGCTTHSDAELALSDKTKRDLDVLHMHKIELADEVLVLNVGGYVGPSTRREIAFAIARGKTLRFMNPENAEAALEHPETRDAIESFSKAYPIGPIKTKIGFVL